MRIPFLQLHQSAFPRARTLAGLLKVHRREALGLVVDLWFWGLELSPEEEITGVFLDDSPAEFLAAGLEWAGDPEALLAALVRAGFVELVDGGFRVKGLDLYAEILEERRKDRERKAAAAQARARPSVGIPPESAGRQEESTRNTQTQTQTQRTATDPPSRARVRAEHRADRPPPQAPETPAAPTGPEPAPLVDALDEIHRAVRGRPLEWGRPRDRIALERATGDLAAEHGDAEVCRRLRNALTVPAGKFPYFAEVGDLVKHWSRYADPAPEPAASVAARRAALPPDPGRRQELTPEEQEREREASERRREQLRRQHPRAAEVLDLAAARSARAPPDAREEAITLSALRLLPFGERVRVYRAAQEQVRREQRQLSPRGRRMARRFHLAKLLAAELDVAASEMGSIPKVGGT